MPKLHVMCILWKHTMADIKWNTCCLCHLNTYEPIQTIDNESCKSIADNAQKFHEIDTLPLKMDIFILDERTGVETSLANHVTSHKSCCLEIAITKLNRALK